MYVVLDAWAGRDSYYQVTSPALRTLFNVVFTDVMSLNALYLFTLFSLFFKKNSPTFPYFNIAFFPTWGNELLSEFAVKSVLDFPV
jgi:hypothetical protein